MAHRIVSIQVGFPKEIYWHSSTGQDASIHININTVIVYCCVSRNGCKYCNDSTFYYSQIHDLQ